MATVRWSSTRRGSDGAASSAEAPIAAEITREIRTSLHSARQMADELQPVGLLEHGFVAAIDELAAHTRQRAGIACTVQDQGFPGDLDAFVATHLFRIAQEAVANSLQHARADSIHITLAVDDGHVRVERRDEDHRVRVVSEWILHDLEVGVVLDDV